VKIIIDTDPGQDDAVAMLLAFASPELEVVGITTVAGNVPLQLTSRNARIICELAGRTDVPVVAGHDAPLDRPLVTAEYVHGKSGLDGAGLPPPTMELTPGFASDWLESVIDDAGPGEITLCTLGPLTNVAAMLRRRPDLAQKLAGIVMMGGGYFEGGNVTPAAEFNVYVDPTAASIVFNSGAALTLLPLDVTHQVLTTDSRLRAIEAVGSPATAAVAGMLRFSERFDEEKYGTDGGPLHDPTVIAYLLEPGLFESRECNVEIETTSPLTMGATVVDWWGVTQRPLNCTVIGGVDDDGFFRMLIERLATL
jgi:purine nucleosidase